MSARFTADDHRFMARALRLAARGLNTASPNPRVGCVIVRDGRIIGEGWHESAGKPHAEINALNNAPGSIRDADVFVTLEPCAHQGRTPPCANALIEAGVRRVVAAHVDPNPLVAGQGLARLRDAGIETADGLLADQAQKLNPGFIKRMGHGRPFVRAKLAMSLDGRTALANGESQWITGPQARADGHRWRARACSIVTGIETVLADDPSLNQRLDDAGRQPVRVVLDSSLRCPSDARLLSVPGRSVLLTTRDDAAHGVAETVTLAATGGKVDLQAAVAWLAGQQFNEVHLEAGATLTGAFVRAGLVDELVLYIAPKLLGSTARGLIDLGEIHAMADVPAWRVMDSRRVGADQRMILRP